MNQKLGKEAKTAKHTPGPWRIAHETSTEVAIFTDKPGTWKPGMEPDPSGRRPGDSYVGRVTPNNARLIAAAPDLLEALKAQPCYSCGVRLDEPCDCITSKNARAAIAKAKGSGSLSRSAK